MKTNRVISLKDFTLGLVIALAEREVLVIDKPRTVVYAAIEAAYNAIRGDIEREHREVWCHTSLYDTPGGSFETAEIIDFALGAQLMTCEHPGNALGIVCNEHFTRAYFRSQPTRGDSYRKAAQAFLDCPG